LQRQPHLRARALNFEPDVLTGLHQGRQNQIEHLAADFHLRAAIGRRSDDSGVEHLSRLQCQGLQRAGPGGSDELG
jgi:hypothetical protein